MGQIHKRFTDDQVKHLIQRYLKHEIERTYLQSMLDIGKSRFFELIQEYRRNPEGFTVQYHRKSPTHLIDPQVENNILKELKIDKNAIEDKHIPLKRYNYSYVQRRLDTHYQQNVSLSTVIARAKKHGFYLKRQKTKPHDREVLTHYLGELIQHDSSLHLYAPASLKKWYLITSLDDFSRFILYAILLERETVWAHIQALQSLVLRYGLPYSYYVDSHSIFRFVRGRDEFHYTHHLQTDQSDTQWKQVLGDLSIKIIYALSPQAKGKIERPYGWIQDHLVRTCIRENVKDIQQARTILGQEVHAYNYKRVHSTTGEIPYLRFQKALKEKQTLFREFKLVPPFKSFKDIFCLRIPRTTDAYRKVSINNLHIRVNGVPPHQPVTLRVHLLDQHLSEVRFWHNNNLTDIQKIKTEELGLSTFNPSSVHF